MKGLQSHLNHGAECRLAAADLTGLEGRFVVVDANGKFALAGDNAVDPLYVLLEGGVSGANVSAEPVSTGRRYRVRGGAVNFALKGRVVSGANGLAKLVTLNAANTNLVFVAGVVEEANNIGTSDTGAVLILGTPYVSSY